MVLLFRMFNQRISVFYTLPVIFEIVRTAFFLFVCTHKMVGY